MNRILMLALSMVAAQPVNAQLTRQQPDPLRIVAVNVTAEADETRKGSGALPGDVLEYRLHFTNVTGGVVRNVVFDDPIPTGLVYLPETAGADRSDVVVQFSIDGGATFSTNPMVEVVEEGRKVLKPAPAHLYTHIRWTVKSAVLPNASVTAKFRARVGGGGGS